MNNRLILLANLLLLATAAVVSADPSEDADAPEAPWVPLFQIIYNSDKETAHLTPDETLALVKELKGEVVKDKDLKPDDLAFILGRLQNLIDASVVKESQCNKEHFEDLSKIFDAHEDQYWNILTYLHHFRGAQIALCKPKIDSLLVKADDLFSEEESEDVALLVRQTKWNKKVNFASRIDGLLDFMETKVGPIRGVATYKEDRQKLIEVYEATARKLCAKVVDNLEPIVGIYSTLGEEAQHYDQLDKLTLTWLDSYQVCSVLLTDMDALIRSPSRILVSLISKPKRSA